MANKFSIAALAGQLPLQGMPFFKQALMAAAVPAQLALHQAERPDPDLAAQLTAAMMRRSP